MIGTEDYLDLTKRETSFLTTLDSISSGERDSFYEFLH
jgi:hypothetical protein